MHIKKVTKKDRYGNQVTTEYEVPEKSLDYTELLKKKMELAEPDMEIDIMSMGIPPVMGEEFNMGDPNNHPGEPMGSDTVPAWLTPGEFVVNKEATEMFGPEIEAMNEVGKMAKGGAVQYHADGAPVRGSAAQIMAGMDPAQIVRMMGNLGNAYQYLAPALGMNTGGAVDDAMDFAGPETLTDAQIAERMAAMRAASPAEEAVPVPGMAVPEPMLDALLHSREGFRDDVYLDSLGKPTVGYGHLLGSEYADKVGTTPFTQDELDSFFREDRETAESAAKRNVGEDTWNKLNKRQKATLSSMAFQLGEAGQKKFKNMIKAIQNDDYREAAKQALTGSKGGKSKWLKQTPVRALDLAEAFDPTIAAQYRDAGGVVFDDMPVQYAFLGKLLGSPAEPTPEINWQGNAGMLSELINQGYTPEQAIAAIKNAEAGSEVVPITGDLAAPPVPTPREGATVEGEIAKDIALGSPVGSIADPIGSAIGGIDHDLLVEETEKAIAESPETSTVFTPLTGDNFESDIWKIEEDERRAQQSRAGLHVENAQAGADVAAYEAEQAAAALDEIPLTDVAARDAQREEIARLEKEAADAAALVPEYKAKQVEDEEDFAVGQIQSELDDVEEAISIVTNEEDLAALEARKAELEAEKAGITTGEKPASETGKKEQEEAAAVDLLGKLKNEDTTGDGGTASGAPTPPAAGTGKSEEEIAAAGQKAMQDNPEEAQKTFDQIADEKLSNLLGEKGTIGGSVGEVLAEMFDAKELTKMAIYTVGSLAFGASPMNALQFGIQKYVSGIEGQSAAKAKAQADRAARMDALIKTGKYDPVSIQKYIQTGNAGALKSTEKAKPTKDTGKWAIYNGKKRRIFEFGDGTQILKGDNGEPVPVTAQNVRIFDEATMGSPAIKSEFSDWIRNSVGRANEGLKEDDAGRVSMHNSEITNEANRLFQKHIADSNLPIDDAEALKAQIGGSIDDMVAFNKAAKAAGTEQATSLKPFLDARMVSIKTGVSKSNFVGSSPEVQYRLNNNMERYLTGQGYEEGSTAYKQAYQHLWQQGQTGWARAEADKDTRDWWNSRAGEGQNGFTFYMTNLFNDKAKFHEQAWNLYNQ